MYIMGLMFMIISGAICGLFGFILGCQDTTQTTEKVGAL